MTRRLGGLALGMALVLFSITLAAPLVSADHVYSHRFVIFGRVVDADGNPVQGYTVDFRAEFFSYEGTCAPNQPDTVTEAFGPTYSKPITNEFGEFTFCLHAHSMSRFEPGTGHFKVVSPQGQTLLETSRELNGYSRALFVKLQLATAAPAANANILDETYTVAARLWTASGEQKIEGVTVFGDTLQQESVNVTITYNDGLTATGSATTNGYGDFSVRIPVEERPRTGTVTIATANGTWSEPVDGTFGFTGMDARTQTKESPGATLGVVAAAVLGAFLLVGRRRRE